MKTLNHPSSYATAGDTLRPSTAQITSTSKDYLPGVLATKQGDIQQLYKKDDRKEESNYKPIFMFPNVSKA